MASILFQSSWTSIIFEGRNKFYGAYELRQSYEKNMLWGLLITFAVAGAATFCTVWFHHFSEKITISIPIPKETVVEFIKDDKIYDVQKQEVVKPAIKQKTANPFVPTQAPAQDSKTSNPTEVVPDNKVVTDNTGNNGGTPNENNGGSEIGKTGVAPSLPDVEKTPEIVSFAESMPVFEGSVQNYIATHFNYPMEAMRSGIDGKMVVEIILDEKGKVISARVLKSLGYGCDEEAIRTVLAMPDWKPAMHGNRPVKIRLNIPIKLKLD